MPPRRETPARRQCGRQRCRRSSVRCPHCLLLSPCLLCAAASLPPVQTTTLQPNTKPNHQQPARRRTALVSSRRTQASRSLTSPSSLPPPLQPPLHTPDVENNSMCRHQLDGSPSAAASEGACCTLAAAREPALLPAAAAWPGAPPTSTSRFTKRCRSVTCGETEYGEALEGKGGQESRRKPPCAAQADGEKRGGPAASPSAGEHRCEAPSPAAERWPPFQEASRRRAACAGGRAGWAGWHAGPALVAGASAVLCSFARTADSGGGGGNPGASTMSSPRAARTCGAAPGQGRRPRCRHAPGRPSPALLRCRHEPVGAVGRGQEAHGQTRRDGQARRADAVKPAAPISQQPTLALHPGRQAPGALAWQRR